MSEIVSVIASGESWKTCGADRAPGFVIAVNDMFRHVPHDAVLSMDGLWAKNRATEVLTQMFMWEDTRPRDFYLRRSAHKYFNRGDKQFQHITRVHVFDCDNHSDVMSPNPAVLNGRHSGQCALNLAFTRRPRTVFLYGFDLRGDALGHGHPDYEWKGQGNTNNASKFREWADGFHVSAKFFDAAGIRVFNTNPESAIKAFPFGRPAA